VPVAVMLLGLGALFLGDKITPTKLFWLSVSFIGMMAIVSAKPAGGAGTGHYLAGIALSLAAAFFYAIAAIVTKLLEQMRMGRQAKEVDNAFWNEGTVQAGTERLAEGSPFRFIADAGVHATRKHDGLRGKVDFADFVDLCIHRATERVQRRLSNGMSLLATVGSTAPFVGLFGTVWGIYHALTAIGIAGQASIDKVAGPVGESLIMTAIGLAVAVPAVLGYNWLLRRNITVMDDVREFSGELHSVILAGSAPA